jgi:hypothetical protein
MFSHTYLLPLVALSSSLFNPFHSHIRSLLSADPFSHFCQIRSGSRQANARQPNAMISLTTSMALSRPGHKLSQRTMNCYFLIVYTKEGKTGL